MMWLMLGIPTASLILHQIANNLASVVVTLTAWWIVLMMGLSCTWIYDIEVATWFLMLMSEMTIEEERLDDALKMMLLRFLMWFLMFEKRRWNENQSGKEWVQTPHQKMKRRGEVYYSCYPCQLEESSSEVFVSV